jgi:RHS repeat-associated protein
LSISQAGGNSSTFSYGAERNRYRTISVDDGVTEDKLEIAGGAFERVVSGTSIQYRHYIQVNGKAVAIWTRNANTSAPTTLASAKSLYLHEDHLGSLDVITDETNSIAVRTSFDAWGQRRGSNWTGAPSAADRAAIAAATRKGYTGHQQLDNLHLVHMNGRVYDPQIGRFMSADPIIQDPYHSQAFNRYSYVWNNPLNGTDPSGFACLPHEGVEVCDTKPTDYLDKHPADRPVQQNGLQGAAGASSEVRKSFSKEAGKNSAQETDRSEGTSGKKDGPALHDSNPAKRPAELTREQRIAILTAVNREARGIVNRWMSEGMAVKKLAPILNRYSQMHHVELAAKFWRPFKVAAERPDASISDVAAKLATDVFVSPVVSSFAGDIVELDDLTPQPFSDVIGSGFVHTHAAGSTFSGYDVWNALSAGGGNAYMVSPLGVYKWDYLDFRSSHGRTEIPTIPGQLDQLGLKYGKPFRD